MPHSSSTPLNEAQRIADLFDIPLAELPRLTDFFVKELRDGLKDKCTWQIPSYVTSLPNGREKGTVLAIDLGGTNCRICSVKFNGDSTYAMAQSKRAVPAQLRINASYRPLFAFIAGHLADFLDTLGLEGRGTAVGHVLKLAFTFSFTCEQTSLRDGVLLQWDKGWDIPDAIGKNPCDMLQEAIDSLGLPVDVCVLANDSVGTLMAGAFTSNSSRSVLAGLVFGTGTNAAYVEKAGNIKSLRSESSDNWTPKADDMMIVNTEWGRFGDDTRKLPNTMFDDMLDAASSNPRKQLLEKRVSGLYLGELLRLALIHFGNSHGFDMTVDEDSPLYESEAIGGLFLSTLARQDLHTAAKFVNEELSAKHVSLLDVQVMQMLAAAIVTRAARLAGAALAAIVIQSGWLHRAIPEQVPCESRLETMPARDHVWIFRAVRNLYRSLRSNLRKVYKLLELATASPRLQAMLGYRRSAARSVSEANEIEIEVDGSLIEFHPAFQADMRRAIREIPSIGVEGEKLIQIRLAKDGSGVGAALIAQTMEKR